MFLMDQAWAQEIARERVREHTSEERATFPFGNFKTSRIGAVQNLQC